MAVACGILRSEVETVRRRGGFLALAENYDGRRRSDAARLAGVGLQIIRDWVLRFNAEGPDGLINHKGSGPPSRLTDEQRAMLRQAVEEGPKPYLDGVVRWRLVDLVQWAREEFGVSISRQTMGRELRAMGFRRLSARPRHYAQNPEAIEAFKKLRRSGHGHPHKTRLAAGGDLVSG